MSATDHTRCPACTSRYTGSACPMCATPRPVTPPTLILALGYGTELRVYVSGEQTLVALDRAAVRRLREQCDAVLGEIG